MSQVLCYGYAEDALSCAVMTRLVAYCNALDPLIRSLHFRTGFPANKRGCGHIKNMIPKIFSMAENAGLVTFILADLDMTICAPALIREWFNLSEEKPLTPASVLFRIAEREVEAWVLADRIGLASFLSISPANFSLDPDALPDPKQHLLNIIRLKGRRRYHKEMLPSENAHVGPAYNPRLCAFVKDHWDIARAAECSRSLKRAINAINRLKRRTEFI